MVISTLSFDGSRKVYKLSDEIMINPTEILDDKGQVYRISLGRADCTESEAAMYKPLFDAIDKQLQDGQFLNGITINSCGKQLTLDSAFVTRTANKYGRFYELEAVKDDLVYRDTPPVVVKEKKNAGKAKNKTV